MWKFCSLGATWKGTRGTADASDTEVRVKLKALEERVGTAERGVKDALDIGKKATSAPTAPGPASAWWNKLLTRSNSNQIVGWARHYSSHPPPRRLGCVQYILAKPDFALHSRGARIIPSLTSPTFEIRPQSLGSQMIRLVTRNGYAIGRPLPKYPEYIRLANFTYNIHSPSE